MMGLSLLSPTCSQRIVEKVMCDNRVPLKDDENVQKKREGINRETLPSLSI